MDAGSHLRRLQDIHDEEVRSVPVTEHHRYFWMDGKQVPESLRGATNLKDGRLKSDYEDACESVSEFWKDFKSEASAEDRQFVQQCATSAKRDTVAKIMVDTKIPTQSEYDSATQFDSDKKTATDRCEKLFHIKSNPITKFAEVARSQQAIMRK